VSDGFSETKAAGLDGKKVALLVPVFMSLTPFSCLGAAFATLWTTGVVAGTSWEDCFVVTLGFKPDQSPRAAYALFFAAVKEELKSYRCPNA
jgi:hypothetical protein